MAPLLKENMEGEDAMQVVKEMLEKIESNVQGMQDTLLGAKISQAHHANASHGPDPEYKVGDRVLLATARRRRDYMQ